MINWKLLIVVTHGTWALVYTKKIHPGLYFLVFRAILQSNFYPTALSGAVEVLFSPIVSGWAGGGKKFVRPVSRKP